MLFLGLQSLLKDVVVDVQACCSLAGARVDFYQAIVAFGIKDGPGQAEGAVGVLFAIGKYQRWAGLDP